MNHYKHLNVQERYQIKEMLYQEKTIIEIAKILNPTVSVFVILLMSSCFSFSGNLKHYSNLYTS